MKRSFLAIVLLSFLAFLAALYCFAGYAMNASFSVNAESEYYRRLGVRWGIGGIAFLMVAIGGAVAAWRVRGRDVHSRDVL